MFLIADTRICRDALVQLLSGRRTVRVVGSDCCRLEVLDKSPVDSAHLLLVDMASTDSLAFVQAASTRATGIKVVGYGIPDDTDNIFTCAEAGASGYLVQSASVDELLATVEAVLHGDFAYPPMVVAKLIKRVAGLSERSSTSDVSLLSPRERQIVGCISDGLSNKEIARHLNIETHTVKNHVHNILTKLHLQRRHEAAHILELSQSGSLGRLLKP